MKKLIVILGLIVSANVGLAEPSTTKTPDDEALKEMLRRLVPEEEASENAGSKALASKALSKKGQATDETKLNEKAAPSSKEIGASAIPFAIGLFVAFGFFTLANRRQQSGGRAIRRIAIEPLAAKQNLILVEALGEYLLVATGGREPVLLAQLDTDQAKERLEALQLEPANNNVLRTSKSPNILGRFASSLKKMSPKRTPSFDDMLDEAPLNIETKEPKKSKKPSPAKLALAQAAFKGMENDAAPKRKSLNERLAEIAEEEASASNIPADSRAERADAIRRKLASL
ncbi:MAG: flagellar biosynthetic protein FliO [Myxococcota bacterium]|nr:flagellar biosynthetic protein FliO [Myxococcota bacterium]